MYDLYLGWLSVYSEAAQADCLTYSYLASLSDKLLAR
jgi:hypothetical protein